MKYRGKQSESYNTHTCSTSKISRQIVVLQGTINSVLMPWANLLPILVICPCRRKDFQDLKRAMVQIFMKLKSIQILSMVKYCRKLLSKIQQVSSHFINHETRISYLKSRKDPLIAKCSFFFLEKWTHDVYRAHQSRCIRYHWLCCCCCLLLDLLLVLVAVMLACVFMCRSPPSIHPWPLGQH